MNACRSELGPERGSFLDLRLDWLGHFSGQTSRHNPGQFLWAGQESPLEVQCKSGLTGWVVDVGYQIRLDRLRHGGRWRYRRFGNLQPRLVSSSRDHACRVRRNVAAPPTAVPVLGYIADREFAEAAQCLQVLHEADGSWAHGGIAKRHGTSTPVKQYGTASTEGEAERSGPMMMVRDAPDILGAPYIGLKAHSVR